MEQFKRGFLRHSGAWEIQELSKIFQGSTQSCGIESVENGNSRLR